MSRAPNIAARYTKAGIVSDGSGFDPKNAMLNVQGGSCKVKTVFQVISRKGTSKIFTNAHEVAEAFKRGRAVSSTPLTVTDEHYTAIVSAQPYYQQIARSLRVKREMVEGGEK